jgi:hypothetical protein
MTLHTPAGSPAAEIGQEHGGREVPRRNRGEHADRLLLHDQPATRHGLGDGVAIDPLAFLGEEIDEPGGIGDLAAAFGQRLALLGGHDDGQVLGIGEHQVGEAAQHNAALLGGLGTPRGLHAVRRPDGAARLRRGGRRYRADRLAGGGVVHGQRRAGVGIHPLAFDEVCLAEQTGVLQRQW